MIPSERTMLPLTMLCVAGFVTILLEKPSWHRPASGCLLHSRAYRAFSASPSRPLMDVYPFSSRSARFCSAAATAEGKYPYSFGRSNPAEAVVAGAGRDASAGTASAVDCDVVAAAALVAAGVAIATAERRAGARRARRAARRGRADAPRDAA